MAWALKRLSVLAAIAGAAATVSAAARAEERLLVQDADVLVVVDREVPCGQPVPVTVRASDPGLFTEGNRRLQAIVDGSRAILAFECARVPALEITGERNAEAGTVFEGRAGDETGWLVRSANWQAAAPASQPDDAGPDDAAAGGRQVAGLSLGMARDRARNVIASEFQGAPVRADGANRLVVGEAACLETLGSAARTRPGQRCLIADFGRTEPQRLVQITLHQAVDGDQRADIRDSLVERYGQPIAQRRGDARPAGSQPQAFVRLSWGEQLPEAAAPAGWPAGLSGNRYTLDAYVAGNDGGTELTLWLADPSSPPDEPEYRAKF